MKNIKAPTMPNLSQNWMASKKSIFCSLIWVIFLLLTPAFAVSDKSFAKCMASNGIRNISSPLSKNYKILLDYSIQNLRYAESHTPKPHFIIFPVTIPQVQAAVTCARKGGFEIRVRSGGHSYEGTSCTAEAPFVIIDLANLNAVKLHVATETAWMGGGATLGEIYYAIAEQTSGEYGFSAGSCPTVGAGGHISGGGFGLLSRKHGLAADNVVDAHVVDAEGRLLDRKTMGEDFFWALRGGGGGSWGIVVAWKIKLLRVPPTVTLFSVSRQGLHNVAALLYKWQTAAPALENEFYLSAYLQAPDNRTTAASFSGMYLGRKTAMLKSLNSSFPELGIVTEDCKEMSWIESVLFFSGRGSNVSSLTDRYDSNKLYFYAKSDYVRNPIPLKALVGGLKILREEPLGNALFDPYGGRVGEISADSVPFPHRAGNIFAIQYFVSWYDEKKDGADYLAWLRKFYAYMQPYVSQNPRAAYVNYMDLDLGSVGKKLNNSKSAVAEASKWGKKYFLINYERLVRVKTRVDPHNVFRNVQSIPPDIAISRA